MKQDVTVRQLAARNKRLEELAALKDEFVAKVSHELRNPLTAIREGINLMLDEALGRITPEQRDYLRTVDENLDRLTALVTNMLDLSKIEAGRLQLVRRRLALGPLIAETLSSYKAMAGSRRIKLDLVPMPDVFADPHRVLQVLGNLFSNAVKFTDEQGIIIIALHEEAGAVGVTIRDNGIGIASDELPKLFQKFSQVGPADQRPKGTGLGLALCKELIESHHGRMRVKSELGRGAAFTFLLPRYTAQFALQESFHELAAVAATSEPQTLGVMALDADPLLPLVTDAQRLGGQRRHLEYLAELVRQCLRGDVVLDVEPRWVVVMMLSDARGVQAVVRRLRQALCERLAPPGTTTPVRIAFGAAMYPADGSTIQALLSRATTTLNSGLTTIDTQQGGDVNGEQSAHSLGG